MGVGDLVEGQDPRDLDAQLPLVGEPGEGVEVLARYVDQFYAGAAAVVRNKYGKGTVTHVGSVDEGSSASTSTSG